MNILISIFSLSALAVMLTINGCSRRVSTENQKDKQETISAERITAGPPAIIYKTKEDYFDKVPVILSEDRNMIVGYPSLRDIMAGDEFSYPTRLEDGFLLDNRGINEHAAFLSLTYEEYAVLQHELSPDYLFAKILDSDPFIEMYRCGSKFQYRDIVTEMNQKIHDNGLSDCKKLK